MDERVPMTEDVVVQGGVVFRATGETRQVGQGEWARAHGQVHWWEQEAPSYAEYPVFEVVGLEHPPSVSREDADRLRDAARMWTRGRHEVGRMVLALLDGATVEPQPTIPVPVGWQPVAWRKVERGEHYLESYGEAREALYIPTPRLVLERVPEEQPIPEPVEVKVHTAADGTRWVETGEVRAPRVGERYLNQVGVFVRSAACRMLVQRRILTPAPAPVVPVEGRDPEPEPVSQGDAEWLREWTGLNISQRARVTIRALLDGAVVEPQSISKVDAERLRKFTTRWAGYYQATYTKTVLALLDGATCPPSVPVGLPDGFTWEQVEELRVGAEWWPYTDGFTASVCRWVLATLPVRPTPPEPDPVEELAKAMVEAQDFVNGGKATSWEDARPRYRDDMVMAAGWLIENAPAVLEAAAAAGQDGTGEG